MGKEKGRLIGISQREEIEYERKLRRGHDLRHKSRCKMREGQVR